MDRNITMKRNHININPLSDYSPILDDKKGSFSIHPLQDESESEYDEDQFGNVDEDVINVRAKDFMNYQHNSSSIELLEENLREKTSEK